MIRIVPFFFFLLLTSCSTVRISEEQQASVNKIGLVVVGLDSITTVHTKPRILGDGSNNSYKLPNPFFSKFIGKKVEERLKNLGYEVSNLSSEAFENYFFEKFARQSNQWSHEDLHSQLKTLFSKSNVDHVLIVGPERTALLSGESGPNIMGIGVGSSSFMGLGSRSYFVSLKAEFLTREGQLVGRAFIDKVDGESFVSKEFADKIFSSLSEELKRKSFEYFKKQAAESYSLVDKLGIAQKRNITSSLH